MGTSSRNPSLLLAWPSVLILMVAAAGGAGCCNKGSSRRGLQGEESFFTSKPPQNTGIMHFVGADTDADFVVLLHSADMAAAATQPAPAARAGANAAAFPPSILLQGWLYLAGTMPFADTDVVDATATGSTMAVWFTNNRQIVFFLKTTTGAGHASDKVKISFRPGVNTGGGPPPTTTLSVGKYQEINRTGSTWSFGDTGDIVTNAT